MASDKYRPGPNASMYDSWTYEGAYANWYDEENKPLTKKCTCGTFVTYGDSIGLEGHQTYCDLVRKDESN